ncbi:MAG: chromosomal replication initiator protein DnaA [Planctomycetes bacterium]|nr:chromosomal replication initiator protein DnaA [Planctomycetota bacterium]
MSITTLSLWNSLLNQIRKEMPQQSFETWFACSEAVEISAERLEIQVPSLFIKKWIERKYSDLIINSASVVLDARPELVVSISNAPVDSNPSIIAESEIENEVKSASKAPRKTTGDSSSINRNFTLEQYAPGSENRIAYEACKRSIEKPGEFSPLLIYGCHGLGKSHLLHGTALAVAANKPQASCVFMTAEEFVNEYTSAFAEKRLASMRSRLRSCDYLIIEDIQMLLAGKKHATIEEFIHTFDALTNKGKQIILSSNAGPESMIGVDDRLRGRIMSGLSIKLEEPSFPSRIDLIRRKTAAKGVMLDPETAEWVASQTSGCIRELEGAVMKVVAVASLSGNAVTLEALKPHFSAHSAMARPCVAISDLAEAVARSFGLALSDLTGRKRSQTIRAARTFAMLLSRKVTGSSLAEIGDFFGNRSHATVLTALKNAPSLFDCDNNLCSRAENILLDLGFAANTSKMFASQGNLF